MILEQNIPPFTEWLFPRFVDGRLVEPGAFLYCILAIVMLAAAAGLVGITWSMIQYGFRGCVTPFVRAFLRLGTNLHFDLYRTWAVARLTIKESLRRRVLFIFLFFLILLLGAGWFLDPGSEDPAKLYLSFVLGSTTVLIMLLALFLSAFSLPTDVKNKTIYTVITKPVKCSELVLGRIIGIGTLGTVILVLMGVFSFVFVTNGLQHTHLLTEQADLTPVNTEEETASNDADKVLFRGETRLSSGHKHPVTVFADGRAVCETVNGHTHSISVSKAGGQQTKYTVEKAQGTMQARIPLYGKLSYRKGEGTEAKEGTNVGDEWEYRSYIAGAYDGKTATESAVFSFTGIYKNRFSPATLKNGLPVEMTLGVFRTIKGDIEQRVRGNLLIRNPKTGLRVEVGTFSSEEFITKTVAVPVKMTRTPMLVQRYTPDENNSKVSSPSDTVINEEKGNPKFTERQEFDFFEDLVADGQVEIWLQCLDRMQYIGVSQRDLYFRAAEAAVELNFAKGFFSIWMQMLILVSFGVLFSTFLSGTVAMLSTIAVMVVGLSKSFFVTIGLNQALGGGPFESFYRIMIQQNMVTDLPSGVGTSFIKVCDQIFGGFMYLTSQAIPPLSEFSVYDIALVSGFDIPNNWLLIHSVTTLAYVIPVFIIAFLIFSNREIAKN